MLILLLHYLWSRCAVCSGKNGCSEEEEKKNQTTKTHIVVGGNPNVFRWVHFCSPNSLCKRARKPHFVWCTQCNSVPHQSAQTYMANSKTRHKIIIIITIMRRMVCRSRHCGDYKSVTVNDFCVPTHSHSLPNTVQPKHKANGSHEQIAKKHHHTKDFFFSFSSFLCSYYIFDLMSS